MAATALAVFAVSRKPGGSSSAESPCDIHTASSFRQSEKKLRVKFLDLNFRVAVLAFSRGTHLPAERIDHELQSVADAEHGNAEIEDTLIGQRRVFVVHRRRAARQNDSHRRIAANFFQAGVEGQDDRENFLFADAARNQLRILRAEVEDNDGLGFHG